MPRAAQLADVHAVALTPDLSDSRYVPRMLDRLAQAAERQKQLDAMVERLVRENGELREEMDNLRPR